MRNIPTVRTVKATVVRGACSSIPLMELSQKESFNLFQELVTAWLGHAARVLREQSLGNVESSHCQEAHSPGVWYSVAPGIRPAPDSSGPP